MTDKIKWAAVKYLESFLLTGAFLSLWCAALNFSVPVIYMYLPGIVFPGIGLLSGINKKAFYISVPVLVIICTAFKVFSGAYADFSKLISTGTPESGIYITLAIGALLSTALWFMCALKGGIYPIAMLFVLSYMATRITGAELSLLPPALGLGAILLSFAYINNASKNRLYENIPVVALCVIMALVFSPAEGTKTEPFASLAEYIRSFTERFSGVLDDYRAFGSDRVPYSVYMDGYQPLVTELGGPATPDKGDVMEVTTQKPVYLRGTIRKYYTGRSWIDDGQNNRYLYADITRNAVKQSIFDTNREALSGNTQENTLSVTFLRESEASTLFVPHRTNELTMDMLEMVAYYNSTGEVFLTRPIEVGDSYTLSWLSVEPNDKTFEELTLNAMYLDDPLYDEIYEDHTRLPNCISQSIYELVNKTVSENDSDYTKVKKLMKLVSESITYKTNVPYPPDNYDFVSYVLMEGKEGYCTYYATCLSVLLRIAGVPARYAEGYLATPNELGFVTVTGENAHAWTEVYFKGIGWVTFDATASSGEGELDNSSDNSSDNNDDSQAPINPDKTPEPNQTTPTPEPNEGDSSSSPTPSPEPTNDNNNNNDQNDSQDNNQNSPNNAPPDIDLNSSIGNSKNLWWLLWLILAIAVIAFLCYYRLKVTSPKNLADRAKSESERALIWASAFTTLFSIKKLVPEAYESPSMFIRRASYELETDTGNLDAALERAYYSKSGPDKNTLKGMDALYKKAYNALSFKEKCALSVKKIFKKTGG